MAALLFGMWLVGCSGETRRVAPDPSPMTTTPTSSGSQVSPSESDPSPDLTPPREPEDEGTLVGTLVKKPWSKTLESWHAGGTEYFVVETEGGDTTIVRPSERVTTEALQAMVGKKVRVRGETVPYRPYQPASPMEQVPMGPDGKPAQRGGGIRVESIEAVE
jgi:hypothetical protein